MTKLVEAAGVEPASEMAVLRGAYMLSPLHLVGVRLRTDQKTYALARLISACGSGPKPSAYPAK